MSFSKEINEAINMLTASANENKVPVEDRFNRLNKIQQLDPIENYKEIMMLSQADFKNILLFQTPESLISSFSVPTISRILHDTGEFYKNFPKRFVDQGMLIHMMRSQGYNPGIGREALIKMNKMHGKYPILPIDYIGFGCETVVTGLRVSDKYGWRPVSDHEKKAFAHSGALMLKMMGSKDYPETYEEMEEYLGEYRNKYYAYEPQNRQLSDELFNFFEKRLPKPLNTLFKPITLSILDPQLVEAAGFDVPDELTNIKMKSIAKMIGAKDPYDNNSPSTMDAFVKEVYPNGLHFEKMGILAFND